MFRSIRMKTFRSSLFLDIFHHQTILTGHQQICYILQQDKKELRS